MEKLKTMIEQEITQCFQDMLDFAQVACAEGHYKALRSKVLRVGNNAIRNITSYITENYVDAEQNKK
jgi:hypothetical protein